MRKSILIASVATLFIASPAFAAEGTVDISGNVAPACKFTDGSKEIDLSAGGVDLADGEGELNAGAINNKSATLVGWCNGTAATIEVVAGPLDNAGSHADFASRINYTATVDANDVTVSDSTTDMGPGTNAKDTVGIFVGNVVVTLSDAAPTGELLLAGDYEGSVTVTLAPTA